MSLEQHKTTPEFLSLVEDSWYYETKGELDLTEDPDPELVAVVSKMNENARRWISMDASEQYTVGYGGKQVEIDEVTEAEFARRICVSLTTLMYGWR